ncbi:MAG: hypothetical protein QW734_05580 [Candidatus Bathyarchaeia archaeon]
MDGYEEVYRDLAAVERKIMRLPRISIVDTEYLPYMLTRPICIAKEIAKWGRIANLEWLVDNAHILQEMELLQHDMENLKRDWVIAKERREEVKVYKHE